MPAKAIAVRSPIAASSATGRVDFSTGTDSPVSAASSIRSVFAPIRRRSAGTLSPEASSTTSPGTSSAAGTVVRRPSRITATFSGTMPRRASIARLARNSWRKPIRLLSTTTASTTRPSVTLPTATASSEAASRTQISGLLTCRQSIVRGPSPERRSRTFGPKDASLRRICAAAGPAVNCILICAFGSVPALPTPARPAAGPGS